MERRSAQLRPSRCRFTVVVAVVVMCLVVGVRGVTASATQPEVVTIATVGTIVGGSQSGTFTATGAIVDEGTFTFAEDLRRYFAFAGLGAPTFGIVRSVEFFVGQHGSFALQNQIKFTVTDEPGVFAVEGTWAALSGTDAYSALRGQGEIAGTIRLVPGNEIFLFTFTGTVHLD